MKNFSIEIDSNGILVNPDEFIEFRKLEYFLDFNTNTQVPGEGIPSTLELGIAKAKGYVIHQQLMKDLGEFSTIEVLHSDYSDGVESTLDTMAEKIRYIIRFDENDNLNIEDELNPGVILSNGDCIKRIVAKCLSYNRSRTTVWCYDPSNLEVNLNPTGFRLLELDIPSFFIGATFEDRLSNIEDNITVDELYSFNNLISIDDGGTNYSEGDELTVVGGTEFKPTKLKVISSANGSILNVEIIENGLYFVLPVNPLAVTGGSGNDDALINLE